MPEKWGFLHGDKTPGSRCFKRPPLDYRYFARFKAGRVAENGDFRQGGHYPWMILALRLTGQFLTTQ
jgi:hypothetical protein